MRIYIRLRSILIFAQTRQSRLIRLPDKDSIYFAVAVLLIRHIPWLFLINFPITFYAFVLPGVPRASFTAVYQHISFIFYSIAFATVNFIWYFIFVPLIFYIILFRPARVWRMKDVRPGAETTIRVCAICILLYTRRVGPANIIKMV